MSFSSLLVVVAALGMTGSDDGRAPPDLATVVRGNSDFACALYAKLANENGNLFFSPFSISSALAMTASGARGETESAMRRTLRLPPDRFEADRGFRELR